MLVSTSLNTIPFLSNSDSTRLQMSAKQVAQTITHLNCTRPYVIGKDWIYLSETCKLFKKVASSNGEVLYTNCDLMVVAFSDKIEVYEVPYTRETANSFATSLRYKRPVGSFNKGDVIYEYDCFSENVPCYGYNVNTLFMPFFGYNFEDSLIISESLAEKAKTIKYKKMNLYIFSNSIFKFIYPNSRYKFIPEIGQCIKKNIIASQLITKNNLNTYNYGDLVDESSNLTTNSILTKLENAEIINIKIHRVNKSKSIFDTNLDAAILCIREDYAYKVREYSQDFKDIIGPMAVHLLSSNYIMQNTKNIDVNLDELVYIIELEFKKEYSSRIGDKFANRFANKGIVNLILPDELRPINLSTNEPVDLILGPLGIYSRMNFGQISEAIIAKGIKKIEHEILENPDSNYIPSLYKLSNLAKELGENKYSEEILSLSNRKSDFVNSIDCGGLFFEVPSFIKVNIKKLTEFVEKEFNVQISESIKIPRETFKYMKNKTKVDLPIPTTDMVYDKVFTSNIYVLKLMQLAESKLTSREFGSYSSVTRQPLKDHEGNSTGSRLGGMEFDGLISHNLPTVINELRTVKSDCTDLKKDLVNQMLHDGVYTLPSSKKVSYTKLVIDKLITFLNN